MLTLLINWGSNNIVRFFTRFCCVQLGKTRYECYVSPKSSLSMTTTNPNSLYPCLSNSLILTLTCCLTNACLHSLLHSFSYTPSLSSYQIMSTHNLPQIHTHSHLLNTLSFPFLFSPFLSHSTPTPTHTPGTHAHSHSHAHMHALTPFCLLGTLVKTLTLPFSNPLVQLINLLFQKCQTFPCSDFELIFFYFPFY